MAAPGDRLGQPNVVAWSARLPPRGNPVSGAGRARSRVGSASRLCLVQRRHARPLTSGVPRPEKACPAGLDGARLDRHRPSAFGPAAPCRVAI